MAFEAVFEMDRDGRIAAADEQGRELAGPGVIGRPARDVLWDLLADRETPLELSVHEQGGRARMRLRDSSDRQRAMQQLAAAEAVFRSAFDDSPIGKVLVGLDGRIERVNGAFSDLVGRGPDDLRGIPYLDLVEPDHRPAAQLALRALIDGDREQDKGESRLLHVAGDAPWVAIQANAIEVAAAGHRSVFLQIEDITYHKRYEDSLEYIATHDPLTGLHNRSSFARRLDDHAEIVNRYGAAGAVLLLDLDHFKYVADTLGHAAGDLVIAHVAHVLEERLRDSDVLARIGGDEFAALLPRADAESALAVAEDLLQALREEDITVPAMRDRTITASVGVALFEGGEEISGEDMLVSADLAMYDAKEAGRNQVILFRPHDFAQARMQGRITWAERIVRAIEDDRFTLVAQPIMDLETQHVTHFEVLLRMRSERGDLIPPGSFLHVAERLGMIEQIDELTVSKALRAVAAHEHGRASWVEINLSGASIGRRELIEHIEAELAATALDPSHVIFEVTETAAISNLARAREFSQRLGTLGCRFALDDFGAGFGSFYYLKHIAFDYLKIDGEFVRDAVASETDRLVIGSVVGIARGLGRRTVAEHVTDGATVALLRDLGVDYGQGFHLGRPIALESLLDALPAADGRW